MLLREATVKRSTPEQILAFHEALLDRSSRMLDYARQGDWVALIDEETGYLCDVDDLSQLQASVILDRSQQEQRASLLQQILAQNLEIQQHLVGRRDELSRMIEVAQRRQTLDRSYLGGDAAMAERRLSLVDDR